MGLGKVLSIEMHLNECICHTSNIHALFSLFLKMMVMVAVVET